MLTFRHSLPNTRKIARFIAKMAVSALYDEVSLYPKPGLVSFVDNGAHQDMNGVLFYRSLFALRHYFYNLALHSAEGGLPAALMPHGLQAEKKMHDITAGINTHRGAIFALGIVCASMAKLSVKKPRVTSHELQQAIVSDWAQYLNYSHQSHDTNGSWVKKKYHIVDAKQLAIQGYAPVFDVFHELAANPSLDKTFLGLIAYQRLLLIIDDSNVLYRTGSDGLEFARHRIQNAIVLTDREVSIHNFIELHRLFSKKNISPGGVADMLGLIYFLRRIFSESNL
jgi:triphosphoribosyl-dephospho-CoA synthase